MRTNELTHWDAGRAGDSGAVRYTACKRMAGIRDTVSYRYGTESMVSCDACRVAWRKVPAVQALHPRDIAELSLSSILGGSDPRAGGR